jgi:WhiB family redox-sensing transcriptional regulator
MMERALVERQTTSENDPISCAEQLTDWIINSLLDDNPNEPDMPKPSVLATARLADLFGNGENVTAHLKNLTTVFQGIPDERHGNALLYVSGYPMNALEALADGDMNETMELLRRNALPLYMNRSTERRRVGHPAPRELSAEERMAMRGRVSSVGDFALRAVKGPVREPDPNSLEWQNEALCAETDPELFFPEKGGSTRNAKSICADCEVRSQCLAYALKNDERFGIWGGLSERERRKLQKSRNPKQSHYS